MTAVNRQWKQVHWRRTNSTGHVNRPWLIIDLARRSDLFNRAMHKHADSVGHAHRLDLVVRHVDQRSFEVVLKPFELGPHLHAQQSIKCGEGLVEQIHLWSSRHDSPDRNTLTFAARQLPWLAIKQRSNPKRLRCTTNSLIDLLLADLSPLLP